MKTYNVIWEERHKITVEAKNKVEAIVLSELRAQGESTFDEVTAGPDVYEVKN